MASAPACTPERAPGLDASGVRHHEVTWVQDSYVMTAKSFEIVYPSARQTG
jgi:hypothetical protein